MDVRGKLVELLRNAKAAMKSENLSCDIARNMFVVDFMMANGVTVQDMTQPQRCESKNCIQTNAGDIQSMSIAELNNFLRKVANHDDDCPYEYGSVKSLEWLEKPYAQKEYKKI